MSMARIALPLVFLFNFALFGGYFTASRAETPAEAKAYIGIQYEDLKTEDAAALGWASPRGLRITKVLDDTPAQKAGLVVGDIILTIDRVDVRGAVSRSEVAGNVYTTFSEPRLSVLMGLKRPGDSVELLLYSQGREKSTTLVLGSRPPDPPIPPPVCKGADLLAELQAADPGAYARIMASAQSVANAKGLLWRIDRKGLPPSYLFGTMHVTDDRVNELSVKVKAAFAASTRIALEVADLSSAAMLKAQQSIGTAVQYGGGQSLKTELPAADYARLQDVLKKRGIPEHAYDGMRPFVIRMALSIPPCEQQRQGKGLKRLDARLADDARSRGIPVVGLETGEEQFRALSGISTLTQLVMLLELTRQADRLEDEMETLVQAYLRKDITSAMAWNRFQFEKAGLPISALDEEERVLVVKRNHRMREAALPLLSEGGVFIGVGAAHLPGAEGLVELIRQAGFTVSREE